MSRKYNKSFHSCFFTSKGVSKFEGNVYVLQRPVCDDDWSKEDARVICRSLGCSSNTIALPFHRSYFGTPQFADFILDNVSCNGHEKHVGACNYVTVDNCGPDEVAGVRCIDPTTIELKGGLIFFISPKSFLIKLILHDHYFLNELAGNIGTVVCHSLTFDVFKRNL